LFPRHRDGSKLHNAGQRRRLTIEATMQL